MTEWTIRQIEWYRDNKNLLPSQALAWGGFLHKHPHDEIIKRLKNKNIKIYRTDESGSIVAESNGSNITFKNIKTNTNG